MRRESRCSPAPALLAALVLVVSACAPGPRSAHAGGQAASSAPRQAATRAAPSSAPVSAEALDVRYLGNEGFLVEGDGHRVVIDGLFGTGLAGYPVVPVGLRDELERGLGYWSGVRLAIASHFHGDHFDASAVARFLKANPEARFVSTPQAVAKLPDGVPEDRVHAVLPAEGETERLELDGVHIEVFNLHHGRRTPPVENLGVVVTLGDRRFLHLGDTEAKMEDFEPYLDRLAEVDVALLPFWFLTSEWRAAMVRERIRPRAIVVAHLPMASAGPGYFGRWGSRAELVRIITSNFPDAHLPADSGQAL